MIHQIDGFITNVIRTVTYCIIIFCADMVCSWLSPTDADNVLECGDENVCDVKKNDLGWDCCLNKERNRCPANFPVMCAIRACGSDKGQYCCAESEIQCKQMYNVGARGCDSSGRLF